jgi:hypothetical protein
MAGQSSDHCSWCDRTIERDNGWRLSELPGARTATFCRLEHIVPWAIQGAHWNPLVPAEADEEPFGLEDPGEISGALDSCSHCGESLSEVRLVLVRHRGEHRIRDAFCSVDHLAAWAKAGGRWR